MTHGVKCGFAGELPYFSGVMAPGFSSGDPRRIAAALQGVKSPHGSFEISLAW